MNKKHSCKELMPIVTLDQCLENIEKLAEIYFKDYKTEDCNRIKQEILSIINMVEDDVYNTVSAAYSENTVSMLINNFYDYSIDIKYAVEHVVNDLKFECYFKLFKEEAKKLKHESNETLLEIIKRSAEPFQSRKNKIIAGQSDKFNKVIQAAINNIVEDYPDINMNGVWHKLKKFTPDSPGNFEDSYVYVDGGKIYQGSRGKGFAKTSLYPYLNRAKKVS